MCDIVVKCKCFCSHIVHFTLYYRFPFAVQTHTFLRSICRHSHFTRNHTKTHTFRHNIAQFSNNLSNSCVFTMFYSLFENIPIYSDSEPSGKTIQFVSICHVWVACWLGAVWMGWAGWVELAGFAGLAVWLPDHL